MVRMFCTVEEAAEKLDANPDHIETLLEEGILHEFRDGPHRLLKVVEVGALAAARKNPVVEDRKRNEDWCPAGALPPGRTRVPAGSSPGKIRLPRSGTVAVKSPGNTVRPRNARELQPPEPSRTRPSVRRSPSNRVSRPRPLARAGRREKRRTMTPPQVAPQDLSLRQWLWAGLVQDRPAAIALLAGLVLLALSALVAGLCMLRETV